MQLHSPSHDSHYDPQSAISEIRRSLSRSPSKPFHFRSTAASGNTPYAPSPLSPSRRSTSENFLQFQSIASPHLTRSAQTGRVQRPTLRRTAQTINTMRSRISPKSPSKRIFADSTESGQINQSLRKRRSTEIDDDVDLMAGEDKENLSRQNEDQIMSWKTAQTKQEKRRSGGLMTEVPPLSPMKRTDGAMNIDHPNFGSPSAKRRSMYAPSAMDFSIFESDSLRDGTQEKRSQDDHDWFRSIPMSPSSRFSTIPKRSSSLRKSTLQQRQSDKSSPLRLNNFTEMRQNWSDSTPNPKKPVRMSSDNQLPVPQRDSPFSSHGGLLNASIHPMTSSQEQSSQETQLRHPLSNAMTQSSSSTSSVQDDSPTHEPARRADRSKSHDFSKSLPIGALRPYQDLEAGLNQFSSQGSFATPAAYKAAKPLPAAFMSTGLISKKNRNTDEPDAGLPKAHMPDTPCKKQSLMFAPPKEKIKPANATIHNLRTSFGTPRSPSEVPFGITRATPFPWAKSTSIFSTRAKQSMARKASFASIVSIEAEDKPSSQSPCGQGESQSTENEYPPTPTKHMALIEGRATSISPSPQHVMSRPYPPMSSQGLKFANSKLSPIQASPASVDGDSDSVMEDSPSARLKPKSLLKVLSEPNPSFIQGC
ncbi:mitosis inhibitor protein kinase swe1, partial [Neophaeococcomyces mojaviensis]